MIRGTTKTCIVPARLRYRQCVCNPTTPLLFDASVISCHIGWEAKPIIDSPTVLIGMHRVLLGSSLSALPCVSSKQIYHPPPRHPHHTTHPSPLNRPLHIPNPNHIAINTISHPHPHPSLLRLPPLPKTNPFYQKAT